MAQTKKKIEDVKAVNLTANIESHQKKMGFSKEKMGAALGINPAVYRRKVLHPNLFTYMELVKLFTILKFTEAEILESV